MQKLIELKSEYQCPKCKINLDFGIYKSDLISNELANQRYNTHLTTEDCLIERCPKCFREYLLIRD